MYTIEDMFTVCKFTVLSLVLYAYTQYGCWAGRPHTESASMKFYFDPNAHYFVGATQSNCYLVQLTFTEMDHIHTNQGIEDLELRMLHDWLGKLNETRVYHDDKFLTNNINHWCVNQDIYLLGRVLPVEPSQTSALGG